MMLLAAGYSPIKRGDRPLEDPRWIHAKAALELLLKAANAGLYSH